MSKSVLLCSFIFLIFSCADPTEEIKTTFNAIQNYQDVSSLTKLFDEESINYFSEMGKVAAAKNKMDIWNFCKRSSYPLSTRYMVQVLGLMNPTDSTAVIELEDVLAVASLADFGLIGNDIDFMNWKCQTINLRERLSTIKSIRKYILMYNPKFNFLKKQEKIGK